MFKDLENTVQRTLQSASATIGQAVAWVQRFVTGITRGSTGTAGSASLHRSSVHAGPWTGISG